MITKIVSILLSAVTFTAGISAMMNVKTDVGILCAILVVQCGWIIFLLWRIVENTAKRFP